MKTKIYLLFLLFVLFNSPDIASQNVIVDAEIDSVQRLIGEQARIKLHVSYDAGKRLLLPSFDKEIIDGVEIVEKLAPDTQYMNDKKRISITQEYVVTSFDTALYVIPPFEVLVDGEPYFSDELAMAVYTIPVDTVNTDHFFGPKETWNIPIEWVDIKSSVAYFILFVIITAILVWVTIRYVNNKPIIRIVKIQPKKPAHVIALAEMERIKNDSSWRVSSDTKDFYTSITDALREYFNERFGFNATEMTTSEIIENLLKTEKKEDIKELQEILQTADLVKFAKFNPPTNENDRNLLNAIEFINNTKPEAVDENPQPREKKIVNERSLLSKRILLFSIVLLSGIVIALLVLLIYDLYYLLS